MKYTLQLEQFNTSPTQPFHYQFMHYEFKRKKGVLLTLYKLSNFYILRLPALTFVLAHCGKKNRSGNITMQPHQLGTDHDVMCRALCLALQDTSVLVQRSALDLLLQGMNNALSLPYELLD